MLSNAILCPVIALAALTFAVWCWMFFTRVRYMKSSNYNLANARSRATAVESLKTVSGPADNFQNLTELPVLFYALVPLLLITGKGGPGMLTAAWAFVAFRTLHSLVHCTYNNVNHRFGAYLVSSLILAGMWVAFAFSLP